MSIPPESIQVGQCYLTKSGRVRRVTGLPPGRVQFKQRMARTPTWRGHSSAILDIRSFASTVERAVPCDWTPEMAEEGEDSAA
jgi:hypothetical protein